MDFTRINLMVPEDLKEKIEQIAEQEHRSFSGQVRLFLESGVRSTEMKNSKK